jgi:uncharacterized RDD family membrane protein YckC
MSVAWTCWGCGAENAPHRSMCCNCGAAVRRAGAVETTLEWLLDQHVIITAFVGMTAIVSAFAAWTYVPGLLGSWLGIQLCVFGATALRRSRKMVTQTAEKTLRRDTRPPILYIRAFLTDGSEDAESTVPPSWLLLLFAPLWLLLFLVRRGTYEERMAAILKTRGPCVAIGNPAERFPERGFKRLYTTDETWRDTVAEISQRSLLVIIRATRLTPSVAWEIQVMVQGVPPSRIVIFLPYGVIARSDGNLSYEAFREAARPLFPAGLPDWTPGATFITFSNDWSPSVITTTHSLEHTVTRMVSESTGVMPAARCSFKRRLAAAMIDAALWMTLSVVLLQVFDAAIFIYVVVPIDLFVVIVCWCVWQATPGKMLFGLQIVNARTAQPLRMWQCMVRVIVYPLFLLTFGLSFIWAAFDDEQQAWHDKLARTWVVRRVP